jgi:DnaA family protein
MKGQLGLNLRLKDTAAFDNFFPGPNLEALACLRRAAQMLARGRRPDAPVLYLVGAEASGRTHLLQAACRFLSEQSRSVAVYAPLAEHTALTPTLLDEPEHCPLVALDDLDAIAGNPAWEQAIFLLYERLKSRDGLLLVAAGALPGRLNLKLPDLVSRLSSGPVFQLHGLSDEEKILAIQHRATARGFEVNPEVARYILSRYPRETRSLFALLDRLDDASLASQRRVTIPFLRELEAREQQGTAPR